MVAWKPVVQTPVFFFCTDPELESPEMSCFLSGLGRKPVIGTCVWCCRMTKPPPHTPNTHTHSSPALSAVVPSFQPGISAESNFSAILTATQDKVVLFSLVIGGNCFSGWQMISRYLERDLIPFTRATASGAWLELTQVGWMKSAHRQCKFLIQPVGGWLRICLIGDVARGTGVSLLAQDTALLKSLKTDKDWEGMCFFRIKRTYCTDSGGLGHINRWADFKPSFV